MPRTKKNINLDLALEATIEISDAFNNYLDEHIEDELAFPRPPSNISKTETNFMRQQNRSPMMLGGNHENFAETTFGEMQNHLSWK